ncbi:MAG: NAD-dependent epimerase/dehydratase family protein [Acidimicrobiaceae bacterium]|nr:NAD-dependent epimerase/dehydratase family protein [Acidimicrobiaceae bacterium]
MRALVTGSEGFVARHLIRHLELSGDQVTGVDREQVDVTDLAQLRDAVRDVGPDVIYHLAALTHVGDSWSDPVEYTRVNVLGAKYVLDAAHDEAPESTIILISSADVYGVVQEADLPIDEDFRVAPVNPYASSKVEAERLAHDAVRLRGQSVVVARPFNHVGPGQSTRFVVPALVSRLLAAQREGSHEIAVGDLSTRRDFSDVRDVVRAYRLLAQYGVRGEIYNIASGHDVGLADIAQQLVQSIAPGVELVADASLIRPVEIPVMRASIEKVRETTGWEPVISLDQSLRDVVDDLRRSKA